MFYTTHVASFDLTVACWDVSTSVTNGVEKSSLKSLKQFKFSSIVLSMKVRTQRVCYATIVCTHCIGWIQL